MRKIKHFKLQMFEKNILIQLNKTKTDTLNFGNKLKTLCVNDLNTAFFGGFNY